MPSGAWARSPVRDARPVAYWLLACCAMVLLMVVIGGITRLTELGLSITEWQPVAGILPPLNAAQWADAFARYRAIPQYAAVHPAMSLAGFKTIYFWEYVHRLWGRLIGAAFLLPFLWFMLRRRIPRALAPKLAGIFALGALQGAIGWYMVESGLAHRIEVSQYRLALHLAMAVAIYAAMLWVALDLLRGPPRDRAPAWLRRGALAILGLAAVTLVAGSFVAGLRAGYIYNTFPLMGGAWVPGEYGQLSPWLSNWFANPAAAQFDHRLLAETTLLATALLWGGSLAVPLARAPRLMLHALVAMACVQVGLGVATLLLVVPLPLAVMHQAGGVLLVTAALCACHGLRAKLG